MARLNSRRYRSLIGPLEGLVGNLQVTWNAGGLYIMQNNDLTIENAVLSNTTGDGDTNDYIILAGANATIVADDAAVSDEESLVWHAFEVAGLVPALDPFA